MSDILDLSSLVPVSKKIKLSNGKLIECKPLTIRQMINVVKLEDKLKEAKEPDEIMEIITEVLSPFIPELKTNKEIDFTLTEMREIIRFAQGISVPEEPSEAKQYIDPKKKVNSPEESPTSSVSTPVIPPKKS